MTTERIREIVDQLRSHPDQSEESSEESSDEDSFESWSYDTPTEALSKILRDLSLINEYEYEDPIGRMLGDKVSEGCSHIFSFGPLAGSRCNVGSLKGKDRCGYHNHSIFSSETRDRLHKFKDQFEEKPRKSSPEKRVYITHFENGLFLEENHNLILRRDGAAIFMCVGYLTEDKSISPLTPELETVCDELGISHD